MTSKRQSLSIQVKKSVLEAVESETTNHSELSRRFKIYRKRAMRVLREYFHDDPVALIQFYKLDDAFSKERCGKMNSHIYPIFSITIIMIRFVAEKVLVEILIEILKVNIYINGYPWLFVYSHR